MLLAIDLGSTSFKAAVFEGALRRVGAAGAAVAYRYGAGGVVEIEVGAAEAAFRESVSGALASAGVAGGALRAVAITSQAQTFTVADSAGRPKEAFVSWQDGRAEAGRAALLACGRFGEFSEHCSFGELLKELQVSQLRLIRDRDPGRIGEADRVVGLPEHFVHACTGRFALDANVAAMSGLYSRKTAAWWAPALEACGLKASQLAEVIPVGSIAAATREGAGGFGLPAGIPVVLAGNDQTAGAYGAGVHEKGALLLTLGTAQVAYTCEPAGGGKENGSKIIRGPYPGGREYRMTADTVGGNIVNWGERVLAGCETDAGFFERAGRAEPGCRGLVFRPELHAGTGQWLNLGLHHAPPDLARSILEALVGRMKQMVADLGIGSASVRVLAAGGGSRQPLWVGMVSGALGAEITPVEADPLAGAARMAMDAMESSA